MRKLSIKSLSIGVASSLVFVVAAAAAYSSAHDHPAAPSVAPGEVSTSIATNTQATIEDVKIGAGNFTTADTFLDDKGQPRKGTTCALWLFVLEADGGQTTQTLRVHAGQHFDAGTQHFEVQAVRSGTVVLVSRARTNR